jgi:hypothetical protein
MFPAPALPGMTANVPPSCEPVQGGVGAALPPTARARADALAAKAKHSRVITS